jgi:hypothetical protein
MSDTLILDILEDLKNAILATPNAAKVQPMIMDTMRQIVDNILATSGHPGIIQIATEAEALAALDTAKAITAASLAAAIAAASTSLPVASSEETIAGELDTKAVTPASLAALTSTSTRKGLVEMATATETKTGTDTSRAITPADLAAFLADLTDVLFKAANGPILVSADASKHRIIVADDGTLSTEVVA